MTKAHFTIFETAIGVCAIAWVDGEIVGAQLPERTIAETRARMARRLGGVQDGEPPRTVREAMSAIVALLSGEKRDLREIRLDMRAVPDFHRRVYGAARAIPPGETRTYGQLATVIGAPGAARAVGQALGRNPFAPIVPCHRIVAAGGKTGGFSAAGGVSAKLKMLAIEGARAARDRHGDLFAERS